MTCIHVSFSQVFILTCSSNVCTPISFICLEAFVAKKRDILRICTILLVVITVCTRIIRLGTKFKLPLFRYKTSVYGILILKNAVNVHTKDVFM